MDTDRQQRLADFVQWCEDHITGDEKGQAQVFLDHLFRAFGQPGVLDVGANYEERVKKTQGGTALADLVWKPHILIEMKKRGADVATAYQQAFAYWPRLVPGRPHYVVLCNFDALWVYDVDMQVDEPVDQVALKDLPDRFGPLAFLLPTEEAPTFGNNNEQVTRDAAALLKAYGFSARMDLLQQLLNLNRAVADRQTRGEPVTAPGIPAGFGGDRAALVTGDCVVGVTRGRREVDDGHEPRERTAGVRRQ